MSPATAEWRARAFVGRRSVVPACAAGADGDLPPVVLRADDGSLLPLDPARWHGSPTRTEQRLLSSLSGPVLDVGCGPGRLVIGLACRGVPALGVDSAAGAVSLARSRGASVLQRSVFEPLPGEGRWRSVLLLDGNLGIGGDAVHLLRRCRGLAAPDGAIVAEVERPGTGWRTCRARLERGTDHGPWFGWSVVGADAIDRVAVSAGLMLDRVERTSDGRAQRWFAHLLAVPARHTSTTRAPAGHASRTGPGGSGHASPALPGRSATEHAPPDHEGECVSH